MKIIRLLAFICVIAILITSCGNSSQSARNSSSNNQSHPDSSSASGKLILSLPVYYGAIVTDIESFKAKNPDIELEIRALIDESNYKDPEVWNSVLSNYLSQMSVEIMSGSDVDIFETSNLSYYKYASSGVFEDLYPYMNSDQSFNMDDYYTNIFEALSYDDKLCVMPGHIMYDLVRINSNYSGQIVPEAKGIDYKELAALYNQISDPKVDFSRLNSASYNLFARSEFVDYIDPFNRKASFNSNDFYDFLGFSKKYLNWNPDVSPFDCNIINDGNSPWFINAYSFDLYTLLENSDDVTRPLLLKSSQGKNVFSIRGGVYSISSFSKNKQLAWDFIKFLISEKDYPFDKYTSLNDYVYNIDQYIGYVPINKNNFKTVAGQILGERYNRDVSKEVDYWDTINKSLNQVSFVDATVEMLLADLKREFIAGRLTEEEYALKLQEKIQMYLNE
jgi:multiple sugar transport system substrate-binding protein